MQDRSQRREAVREYKSSRTDAAVYRIVNRQTGRSLVGTTTNTGAIQNRFAFAQSSNSMGALDQRLVKDVREYGMDAFALEMLEVVQVTTEMTPAQVRDELGTLEALWREKLAGEGLY